jgi:hypothetical protein
MKQARVKDRLLHLTLEQPRTAVTPWSETGDATVEEQRLALAQLFVSVNFYAAQGHGRVHCSVPFSGPTL